MVLAGEQGESLYPLTKDRAIPAVTFGVVFLPFLKGEMTMIARILTTVMCVTTMCVTILTGCASYTLQLPISTNDPANPNAPESAFAPRPNWLQAEVPVTAEQPPTEPISPTHLPTTAPIMYTCPMHAEVVQSSLGRCPKCGMRLVPAAPSKTESEGKQ